MIEKRSAKSGPRYEVRFRAPNGKELSKTFRTRKEAESYERSQKTLLERGAWVDTAKAKISLYVYAEQWLFERNLALRSREAYESVLKLHIYPHFGETELGRISPSDVRTWHSGLKHQAPKSYRVLRAILNTAYKDEIIARNPCQVEGAGQDNSPERPTASIKETELLYEAMPSRLRIALVLESWCSLRRDGRRQAPARAQGHRRLPIRRDVHARGKSLEGRA